MQNFKLAGEEESEDSPQVVEAQYGIVEEKDKIGEKKDEAEDGSVESHRQLEFSME